MSAIRVYADTSVFGGLFDEEFAQPTRLFFEQVESGRFLLVVSPVLEEEINGAPEEVRSLYEQTASKADQTLLFDEAIRLQEAYLRAGIVGPRWAGDALHVAFASVSRCALLVSWNYKHIVHFDKIALYNAINVVEGYADIRIHTPQEVIEYGED